MGTGPSLSGDGNTFAIGGGSAEITDKGVVRIYDYQ